MRDGGILGPGHARLEPGHAHLEIALVLLEDRQIDEWRQFAVQLPARDVLAAGHEVEDILGEEIEPFLEPALVEQPSLADVELHQLEPQRLLRRQRWRNGRGLCARLAFIRSPPEAEQASARRAAERSCVLRDTPSGRSSCHGTQRNGV